MLKYYCDKYLSTAMIVVGVVLAVIFIGLDIGVQFFNQQPSAHSPYDINQDGQIDSSDSKIIYDVFLNCYVATPKTIERCDVNYDGFVNDKDVAIVIEYVLTHNSQGEAYTTTKD